MAQQQQNITIAAPGFNGVNTQLSPLSLGPEWAAIADNCVIDESGRVASRKGMDVETTSNAILSGDTITPVCRFYNTTTSSDLTISAGNNLIMSGTTTLTDITPVAATVTDDDWQMVTFNDDLYLVQEGHDMLMYDTSAATCLRVTDHVSGLGVPSAPTCALGAFGKLWVAKDDTLWWSDTLIGPAFSGGASGSLNLNQVWPAGDDTVTALAEHNGFLIIFGRKSIVIYSGAESPANMTLSDPVRDIGCVARDSVQSIGTDLVFLSHNGLRSLGRTIQEKSSPIGDVSKNVHTDIITARKLETGSIRAIYSPNNGFYLIVFPTTMQVFCFDARLGRLEDGSFRTTVWTGVPHTTFAQYEALLLIGSADGLGFYEGYLDGAETYRMRYYSHPQTFGEPSRLKFPKQIDYFLIGANGQNVSLAWGFGYTASYKYKTFTLGAGQAYEYGVAEYGIAEYVVSADVARPWVNTTGSGRSVSVGFEATIAGDGISVQEINMQTLIGRII